MEDGVGREGHASGERARALAQDSLRAVLVAESTFADRIGTTFVAEYPARAGAVNAFGDAVAFERGTDAAALARELADRAGEGERVTLIASADAFAVARRELQLIALRRLPVVFHALAERSQAGAFALADLGWGVLFAAGVQDAIDLALVARRAAEDSGTPFLVVHERSMTTQLEPVAAPRADLCESFLGPRAGRVHRLADAAHPVHAKMSERAFAERVPFALASAMRGLEGLTGRKHDVIERRPGDGRAMMLVGAGALGEALLGEAERLEAAGHDVGAVKVTALRPFPGPSLIRALARARVVTVLEAVDEPLAQSNPLTREVKAAFSDALSWAPDYPGVGRLPRIHSGVVCIGSHALEAGDLDAALRNMVEGDLGKRLFVMGGGGGLDLEREGSPAPYAVGRFAMRGLVADTVTAGACAELCATVIASALALKCRVSIGASRGAGTEGATLDLVLARDKPRGVAVPHVEDVILIDDPGALLEGDPLARLARGGLLAVPTKQTEAGALWDQLPVYVKAIVFDRHVRVIGFPALPSRPGDGEGEHRFLVAAAFAGVALFTLGSKGTRPEVSGSLVERDVEEALRALNASPGVIEETGRLARRVFEAPLEVPRAMIEQDLAAVRLGRHDTRAGLPPGSSER